MASLQETTVNGSVIALRSENTTTTSKSLALADRDKVVACTNTSAITITVPTDASVNFPTGAVVFITRLGTGSVTLAAQAGATITKSGLLGANEEIYVRKRAANTWVVVERPYTLTGAGGTTTTSGNISVHTFTSGTNTFTVQN
jgi:hypothetical protein